MGVTMRRSSSALSVLGAAASVLFLFVSPVQGQATRTWVSGVGDDVNPCSRTAPCKTFAGAISKTAPNGEINCLDPGGFGSVTIVKSITIDCKLTHAGILNAQQTGVTINFDSFSGMDTRKTVRLRGLSMQGADNGTAGVRIIGTTLSANSEVYLEDSIIDGNFGGSDTTMQCGVSDERGAGGRLFIVNTTIRNVGQYGISVYHPTLGAATGAVDVAVIDSRVFNASSGARFSHNVRAVISRSAFSGNSTNGVSSDGNAQVNVSDSVISHNGTGVNARAGTVRLANNDIVFNGTGIAGGTLSHGGNRISGNTNAGTAPTLLSPAAQ
jgi:hypothetical protein